MRATIIAAATLAVAACNTPGTPTVQQIVAKRDADNRAKIGQKAYGDVLPVTLCTDPAMKHECRSTKRGAAVTIRDAPSVPDNMRPVFEVEVQGDPGGFIYASDWSFLASERQRQAEVQERAACDRKGGVSIGMSASQVRASCWGNPQRINRTQTAHGTAEQWVYYGNYVYLRDGIVTSIQTTSR